MPASSLLLLLSPLLLLVLGLCVVTIVAVCRARPEDVPAVLTAFVAAVCRVVDRLPRPGPGPDSRQSDQVGRADSVDHPDRGETR